MLPLPRLSRCAANRAGHVAIAVRCVAGATPDKQQITYHGPEQFLVSRVAFKQGGKNHACAPLSP